jgi:hypothetical protein
MRHPSGVAQGAAAILPVEARSLAARNDRFEEEGRFCRQDAGSMLPGHNDRTLHLAALCPNSFDTVPPQAYYPAAWLPVVARG